MNFQKFGLKIPVLRLRRIRFCPSAPLKKGSQLDRLASFFIWFDSFHFGLESKSYYYENRDELDQKIKQDQDFVSRLKGIFPSKMVKAYE